MLDWDVPFMPNKISWFACKDSGGLKKGRASHEHRVLEHDWPHLHGSDRGGFCSNLIVLQTANELEGHGIGISMAPACLTAEYQGTQPDHMHEGMIAFLLTGVQNLSKWCERRLLEALMHGQDAGSCGKAPSLVMEGNGIVSKPGPSSLAGHHETVSCGTADGKARRIISGTQC